MVSFPPSFLFIFDLTRISFQSDAAQIAEGSTPSFSFYVLFLVLCSFVGIFLSRRNLLYLLYYTLYLYKL
jgi:hypothetical protein